MWLGEDCTMSSRSGRRDWMDEPGGKSMDDENKGDGIARGHELVDLGHGLLEAAHFEYIEYLNPHLHARTRVYKNRTVHT